MVEVSVIVPGAEQAPVGQREGPMSLMKPLCSVSMMWGCIVTNTAVCCCKDLIRQNNPQFREPCGQSTKVSQSTLDAWRLCSNDIGREALFNTQCTYPLLRGACQTQARQLQNERQLLSFLYLLPPLKPPHKQTFQRELYWLKSNTTPGAEIYVFMSRYHLL